MIILGIDPGIAIVGTGVIQYENNKFKVLYYDAVTTRAHTPLEERIKLVYEGVGQLMDYYKPDARKALANKTYPKDIMLVTGQNINKSVIGDLTAYSIGWTDVAPEICSNPKWWE